MSFILISFLSCKEKINNITFDRREIQLDTIGLNRTINEWIIIKNNSSEEILIKGIKSSCGCTVIKKSNRIIPKKGIDSILIQYTSSHKGAIEESIVVNSNTDNKFDVIRIKGFVK